jgi:hypothetical protein
MSQTNEFVKANLPDYVYFDLQTTNTYNNETGITPQLQFLENRDAPIVENSGEYTMSVTRFSVDTANLPVLVVEPDITGSEHFDPHNTVHRVAIITEGANLTKDTSATVPVTTENTFNALASVVNTRYGFGVGSSDDGEVIVVGESHATPQPLRVSGVGAFIDPYRPELGRDDDRLIYASGRGNVYIGIRNAVGSYTLSLITNSIGFPNTNTSTTSGFFTIVNDWHVGTQVAVSGDGNFIIIGSGTLCPYFWIYDRNSGQLTGYNKTLHSSNPSRVTVAINYDGTIIVIGYPDRLASSNTCGSYEIYMKSVSGALSLIKTVTGSGAQRHMGNNVCVNNVGDVVFATQSYTSSAGAVDAVVTTNNWTTNTVYSASTSGIGNFGGHIAINSNGSIVAISAAIYNTTGGVFLYTFTKSSGTWTSTTDIAPNTTVSTPASFSGTAISFGYGVALSHDGLTIHIGSPYYNTSMGAVQSFQYISGSWVYKSQKQGNALNLHYGWNISAFGETSYIIGAPTTGSANILGSIQVNRLLLPRNETLPSNLINTASIANVSWIPDNTTLSAPTFSQLNGTNTATFPYYHCHSYNNFVDVVNTAIKEAYVANFNKLWTEWVSTLTVVNATFIKAEFINIVARCFSTPPYMEWNSTLDATMYLNTLFSSIGNYYNPARTYTVSGTTQVSTTGSASPLHLRVAFNASLYSLFSSFPATQTIIDGEKFYILNMPKQVASLRDNSTIPLRALPLIPDYPFLYEYHNNDTRELTIPFPTNSVATYPLQDYFIVLKQEISTIDAWCPISSIVFTSNQLPIVVSQFSSANTTGIATNPAVEGNRFALVITDLMTNQQGFRPNIIYNPTAEYRRITLTGNIGIRNIDITVFWRSKTGQLLPFRLPSGGSATLKLFFEKKDRNKTKIKETEQPIDIDIMGGRLPKRR